MGLKALSLNKIIYTAITFLLFGCSTPIVEQPNNIFEKVDVSKIPKDTILSNSQSLKLQNGVYYRDNKPFSGYIKSIYQSTLLQSLGSYLQGKQHGITKTFFPNGELETERNYKNGIAYGRHFGFWENVFQR